MSEKDGGEKDGGPAFPVTGSQVFDLGMTLRDYFAGQALAGIAGPITTANPTSLESAAKLIGYSGPMEGFVAVEAYRMADAMIAERSK